MYELSISPNIELEDFNYKTLACKKINDIYCGPRQIVNSPFHVMSSLRLAFPRQNNQKRH